MQSGVNKDHLHDSKEIMHAAPCAVVMNDMDLTQVASNEFGTGLVEREIIKLADKTDLNEDVCGNRHGAIEAEKQDNTDIPDQGSNINDVNQEESTYPLVGERSKILMTLFVLTVVSTISKTVKLKLI